ncbi:DUF4352 domain-containing protein [Sediminivirga luteola]|uniref:Mpr protein n=1 Tax=Sediminivirga luteola TaxID=1774748 RepID=A0A8J2TZS8_9MICO|nr:DUF4352 domain-containing protein [Sediminivirga luteola]MCI2265088.1 DUF4352 domain-containing protein [Sediminivirga luteola]GGA21662.1 Mpr protein [Sediminivirga luteola]
MTVPPHVPGPHQAPQSVPQATQGYPQGPAPAAPKPKKKFYKRVWFWILALVVFFGLLSAIVSGGEEPASEDTAAVPETGGEETAGGDSEDAEAEPAAEDEPIAGIGDAVASGDMEITVTEVETGVSRVGNEYLGTDASGQFIVVHVSVTNVGDSAVHFTGSDVTLIDDEGRSFSSSTEASFYVEDANSLFEQINPGNTVTGQVVFDVPEDADPGTLEFRGSLFGGTAVISLR